MANRAIAHLLDHLHGAEFSYPGINLKLNYAITEAANTGPETATRYHHKFRDIRSSEGVPQTKDWHAPISPSHPKSECAGETAKIGGMPSDHYLDPYRKAVARRGRDDFGITLWASKQSQRRRFAVFTQMCFLGNKTILDAGCSRGDLAAYLIEHEIPFKHYIGIDALCDVITYAQGLELPGCEFHCGDFVTDRDMLSIANPQVICISGALNTMKPREVIRVLETAWAATSESLLFNFLSSRSGLAAGPSQDPARRHDTIKLFDWALGKTPAVQFRQDYFPAGHDAAILMRKE